MKYLATIFFIIVFACSPKGSGEHQIDYKLDTVIIDSRGEIVMAASSLFLSDFDEKLSTIYYYSNQTAEVEVIDLENFSIKDRIKIEREGPSGVGANVNRFYFLGDSLFVFDNYFGLSFLHLSGNKTNEIRFRDYEFFKELQEASDRFKNNFCFLNSSTKFVSPVYSRESEFKYMALVDLKNDKLETIKFEELNVINNFNITLKSGNSMRSIIQPVDMLKVNNLIYISNVANNDIFTYNILTEEIKKVSIDANKVPAGKSGIYNKTPENFDEFAEILRRMYFEIEYKQLIRDPITGNFYRFSIQKKREKTDELPAKFDIHLIAYDKDFKLLSETFIPEMNSIPQVYYWKDNSIWLHENVEDELGFVRMIFN